MSDYIKREYKLPNGGAVTADFNELGCAMVTIQAMDALFDIINSSVEVVRCKDCKHRDTMPEYEYDDDHEHRTLMGTDFCRWWHDESPNDDDYCSYGERAEK